jgi:hypothetical protein
VISGDGENRRRIVAIGIVKLIVIVLRFTEAVNNVAQVIEERWNRFRIGLVEIADQPVGDQILVIGSASAAGVADGVKHNLTGALDLRNDRWANCAQRVGQFDNWLSLAFHDRKGPRALLGGVKNFVGAAIRAVGFELPGGGALTGAGLVWGLSSRTKLWAVFFSWALIPFQHERLTSIQKPQWGDLLPKSLLSKQLAGASVPLLSY